MIDEIGSIKFSGMVNGAYKIKWEPQYWDNMLTFYQSSNGQKLFLILVNLIWNNKVYLLYKKYLVKKKANFLQFY